jgi:hypothetical protein
VVGLVEAVVFASSGRSGASSAAGPSHSP